MDCTQAQEEFAALLDGELAPEERAAVEGHLSQCSDCLRELDGLKRVDTLYRQLSTVSAPEGLEERVRRGIRSRAVLRFPGLIRPRRRLWPVLAAAAAVLVLVAGAVVVEFGLPAKEMRMASLGTDTVASAPQAIKPALEKVKAEAPAEDKGQAKGGAAVAEGRLYAGVAQAPEGDKGVATQSAAVQTAPPAAPAPPELKRKDSERAIETFGAAKAPKELEAAPMAAPKEVAAESAVPLQKSTPVATSPATVGKLDAGDAPVRDEAAAAPNNEARSAPPPASAAEMRLGARPDSNQASAVENMPRFSAQAPMAPPAENAAKVGEKEDVSKVEEVGKRVFETKDGVWYESGYTDQDTIILSRGSARLRKLISADSELEKVLELGDRVVFKVDEKWYRVGPQGREVKK